MKKIVKICQKYSAAHIMQNYMRRNNLVFSYFVINFCRHDVNSSVFEVS